MNEWKLTDDDSCQHVKKINDSTFELIEMGRISPSRFEVYTDTICLDDFSDAETREIISGFGYKTVEEIKKCYGGEANQVIAECIFEHYSSFALEPLATGLSYEDAYDFIKEYTGKGGALKS